MVSEKQLAKTIAERTGVKYDTVRYVLECFKDAVVYNMADGEEVKLNKFGIFRNRIIPAKYCINPRNGEKIFVEEHSLPKFKFSGYAKRKVRYGDEEPFEEEFDEDEE